MHSKAPWHRNGYTYHRDESSPTGRRVSICNADSDLAAGCLIDSANGNVCDIKHGGSVMAADSRLIFAAPDLLAALQAFVEQATKLSGHPAQYDPYVGALVAARAAIAKATQATV